MNKFRFLLASTLVAGAGLSALAQNQVRPMNPPPGEHGPSGERPNLPRRQGGLAPEKAKAAWDLQAAGVAHRLKLDAAKTQALTKAYVDARESHSAAAEKLSQDMMEKMRSGGNSGGDPASRGAEAMKAAEELNTTERAKLEKALGAALTPDETSKAIASLGTFNRQWDQLTYALSELKLDSAKQQEGLNAIEEFVIASGKARAGDRESMRTTMQEARTKLMDSMKKTLTEEQFKQFEAAFPGARGMGDRPPVREGGRPGREGGRGNGGGNNGDK